MTTPGELSLYEAAGGSPGLLRLAAAHHARCLADPVLEHPFGHGGREDHVERLAAYWGEVLGGPRAGLPETDVLRLHAGTGAEAEMGSRFAACFDAACGDVGTEPRLREVLNAYMTWAVAQVDAVAPVGAVVPDGLPVPRWSWDGLVTTARPTA